MSMSFKDEELVDIEDTQATDDKAGFSIDPHVRMGYFQSLGKVKKVQINGKSFIEDQTQQVRRNSLDGYEMFVILSEGITIVDKLYETIRDANGNITYKLNEQGERIPALECSTYFMPLDMAREFFDANNKHEMLKSPFVERTYHTMNWAVSSDFKVKKMILENAIDKANRIDKDEMSL